jgi:hypothetical protein
MYKKLVSMATLAATVVSAFAGTIAIPMAVNPTPAHAATRLGLHVTQEELNIWRQRMTDNVNGVNGYSFQSIWPSENIAVTSGKVVLSGHKTKTSIWPKSAVPKTITDDI